MSLCCSRSPCAALGHTRQSTTRGRRRTVSARMGAGRVVVPVLCMRAPMCMRMRMIACCACAVLRVRVRARACVRACRRVYVRICLY